MGEGWRGDHTDHGGRAVGQNVHPAAVTPRYGLLCCGCSRPLMALFGREPTSALRPLLRVIRTSRRHRRMTDSDPTATLVEPKSCSAAGSARGRATSYLVELRVLAR